ncbi:MAG TPA: hypothetical protein VIT44_09170 [Cyclobacteriaceae bacterium]
MSSHHIVRDNQEPALLVLEASQIAFEVIEELLEWSPSIIVHESQIELFLFRGIKIDAVIFEEAHQTEVIEKIKDQLPVHLLSYASESPLARALSFLQEKNHGYVNIITDSIDFLNQLKSEEKPKNISVFHQNIRWSLVRSGHFEKWVANDVQIILLDGKEQIVLNADKENMIRINKPESFWIGETLKD